MEKNKQDLPYDLRPSRSGPAVLKGLLENHTQKNSKTGSVDSLLLVVFDQVYSNLSNMLNNFAGPPPSASNNMSDFTFLLDSEGYTIVEFQAKIFDIIHELLKNTIRFIQRLVYNRILIKECYKI